MAVSRGKFCSLSALCTHCYHCAHSSQPENPIGKKKVLVKHTFSGEDFDLVRYLKEGHFDFSSVNAFNFVAIRNVFISLGERWFKDLP